MTMESMKSFMEALGEDSALREGLNGRMASAADEQVAEQVMAYAAEHGYSIDQGDLEQLQGLIESAAANDGELTDDSLEAVSGGVAGLGQMVVGMVDQGTAGGGIWNKKYGPGTNDQFKHAINPFNKGFWTLS